MELCSPERLLEYGLGLRAGAALHLAIARTSRCQFWTESVILLPAVALSFALAEQSLIGAPRQGVYESLAWITDWYRAYAMGGNMLRFSEARIVRYRALSVSPA
jgi:hypothetical protein